MPQRDFMTIAEAARRLGVSLPRAYALAGEGRLPCVRRGRRVLIPRAAWTRWLESEAARALLAMTEQPVP